MIGIAVVDEKNGMMFHERRQSRDRALQKEVLSMAEHSILWMNAYSAKLFADVDKTGKIRVEESFLWKAGPGEFCFVENLPLFPVKERLEGLVLFHWNRRYPADFFFDLALTEPEWKLVRTEEFAGSSHEKITKEIYCHA